MSCGDAGNRGGMAGLLPREARGGGAAGAEAAAGGGEKEVLELLLELRVLLAVRVLGGDMALGERGGAAELLLGACLDGARGRVGGKWAKGGGTAGIGSD